MKTRGKFQCLTEKRNSWSKTAVTYVFAAVCNDGTPENERYHRYTPSGSVEITVDNPNVVFELGKSYYVDFTEAL